MRIEPGVTTPLPAVVPLVLMGALGQVDLHHPFIVLCWQRQDQKDQKDQKDLFKQPCDLDGAEVVKSPVTSHMVHCGTLGGRLEVLAACEAAPWAQHCTIKSL